MFDSIIFDRQINKIVEGMFEDIETFDDCLVCGQKILDTAYEKYSVCSSKCELKASIEADRGQDVL